MYLYVLANEMKRTDKIAEIMQQRKEKEIQALNKVSTTQTKCLHVNNCIVLYYLIVLYCIVLFNCIDCINLAVTCRISQRESKN